MLWRKTRPYSFVHVTFHSNSRKFTHLSWMNIYEFCEFEWMVRTEFVKVLYKLCWSSSVLPTLLIAERNLSLFYHSYIRKFFFFSRLENYNKNKYPTFIKTNSNWNRLLYSQVIIWQKFYWKNRKICRWQSRISERYNLCRWKKQFKNYSFQVQNRTWIIIFKHSKRLNRLFI